MQVVALISGGKDSCFNMMHCVASGHTISALANLRPGPASGHEIDSWMYQTVGHDVVQLYGEAMDLPLYREYITGSNVETGLHYNSASGDETEDLFRLLRKVKVRRDTGADCRRGNLLLTWPRMHIRRSMPSVSVPSHPTTRDYVSRM